MLQNNHSLARPCPSCGAPLRVHSGRLTQKMQCPKCLDTIVLDPAATPEPMPVRDTQKKRASRKNPPNGKVAAKQQIPAESDLSKSYAALLQNHALLAERYADIVTDYDALVTAHAELIVRLQQLSDQA